MKQIYLTLAFLGFCFLGTNAQNTITTGTITGSPFCPCASISVPFTSTGTFNDFFTAQLSDAAGNFASPVFLGNAISDTVYGVIPCNTPSGTGYRIRVVSNNPVVTGSDNGSDLTINLSYSTTINESICQGSTFNLPWGGVASNNGTYSHTYSSINSCDSTINIILSIIPYAVASVSIVSDKQTICSGDCVTFTAVPANGVSNPSYQWKMNGVTIAGASKMTYTSCNLTNNDVVNCIMTSNAVCVTGSPATSNSITVIVIPNVAASVSISTSPGIICPGTIACFTAIPINSGTSPMYQWKKNNLDIPGQTNSIYCSSSLINNDLISCMMFSNSPCVVGSPATSAQIPVTVIPSPIITVQPPSNIDICVGDSTTISVAATGSNLTYSWQYSSGNGWIGINDGSIVDLSFTGTKTPTLKITINDSINFIDIFRCFIAVQGGCSASSNITKLNIVTNALADVNIATPTSTTCTGDSFNFIATPVNGGIAPSYQWRVNASDIPGATNQSFNSVLNDKDTVTCAMTSSLSCANGSPVLSNPVIVTVSSSLTPAVSISATTTTICAGTSLTLTAIPQNGGSSPSYQWKTNGVNAGINSPVFTSTTLNDGDIITCILTSSLSCASPATATSNSTTITVNPTVPVSVTISSSPMPVCPGQQVCFTAISVNGGTPSYQWRKNGISIAGATGNIYCSFIAINGDVVSCIMTSSVLCASGSPATSNAIVITVTNGNLIITETHQDVTCGNNDGSIDLTVTGTGPFIFSWSNGATTEDVSGLIAGNYSISVTTIGGCSGLLHIEIKNNNAPVISETHTNSTCGNANGSINITVTGGVAPYTYLWNNSATTEDLTGISSGNYTLTVSDQNGCSITKTISIINSNGLSVTSSSTNSGCGAPNGSITLSISNGTAPYTYNWSNGASTASIFNLTYGYYYVTVKDAQGCSATRSIYVSQNYAYGYYVYFNSVSPNCSNNGSITATVYGGTAPYSYLWSNGKTTKTITGLSAGYYYLTTTDAGGCKKTGYLNLYNDCYNVIKGIAFNDVNGDCVMDAGEAVLPNIKVTASNGSNTYYGKTDLNGNYTIKVKTSGTFNLSITFSSYQSCSNYQSCSPSSVTFPSVGDTVSDKNFAITFSNDYDLAVSLSSAGARPGFPLTYYINYYNSAFAPFNGNATITFKYDANLIYKSSTLNSIHDAVNHTLTWTVSNVPNYNWNWYNQLYAYFTVPVSLSLGFQLQSEASITPTTNDCNLLNNISVRKQLVTNSIDPNEKEVSPSGDITETDSVLTYTIHFQNTGNDTTHFIILKDTLSPYLEAASVENIASSHQFSEFDISDEGILTWIFNPIYLPDSTTNEPASKGFITFNIKTKPNLAARTEIKNNASIYFDYNEAIVTNTVSTTVNNIFTGRNLLNGSEITVTVFPNPFTASTTFEVNGINGDFDFALYDLLGKKVKEMKQMNSNQFILNRNELEAGIYFFSIVDENKSVVNGKIIVE